MSACRHWSEPSISEAGAEIVAHSACAMVLTYVGLGATTMWPASRRRTT